MKLIGIFILFLFLTIFKPSFALAQNSSLPHDTYMTAQILRIEKLPIKVSTQYLQVKITDGADEGKNITIYFLPSSNPGVVLHLGDNIVIAKTINNSQIKYYFVDQQRLPIVAFVILGFLLLILLIAGWKGVGSILGIFISIGIIFLYIVPQIISGADPLTVCMIGAVVILFVTTYIAHGFSRQTTVALVSTLIALLITFFLAQFIVHITLLNGSADPEAADLLGLRPFLNLKGLLLGGIILSTIGALNDITITQSASIFALNKSKSNSTFKELSLNGFEVGREHAISLVNTLVLAYAGGALSLFIFFIYNPNQQPLWVILNSEFLQEEIMKTIAGTSGLLLSVPIVTLLATAFCNKRITGFIGDFFYSYFH